MIGREMAALRQIVREEMCSPHPRHEVCSHQGEQRQWSAKLMRLSSPVRVKLYRGLAGEKVIIN